MTSTDFQIRQLAEDVQIPESGRQSVVLLDDDNSKVVLFAFAAGHGLAEHIAPLPAIIQGIKGKAILMVGEESIAGKEGNMDSDGPKDAAQHQGGNAGDHAVHTAEVKMPNLSESNLP